MICDMMLTYSCIKLTDVPLSIFYMAICKGKLNIKLFNAEEFAPCTVPTWGTTVVVWGLDLFGSNTSIAHVCAHITTYNTDNCITINFKSIILTWVYKHNGMCSVKLTTNKFIKEYVNIILQIVYTVLCLCLSLFMFNIIFLAFYMYIRYVGFICHCTMSPWGWQFIANPSRRVPVHRQFMILCKLYAFVAVYV